METSLPGSLSHPDGRGQQENSIWGVEGRPLVSVIITAFKDRDNIGSAIASVQHQTLSAVQIVVVDDCSPDDTRAVAERIAQDDARVSVHSTAANSGGPGGPRNVGLDHATAPFVMFLDSDDVLERHACYNLLSAAEESGADLVVARTTRFEVAKERRYGWHWRLYREIRFLETIEDDPEIAIDTIAVAKLYKKTFIDEYSLRFREDIHYEDLIFTAEVFTKARGIQVIPESVYQWNVYPVKVRKSITNQRDDIKNLRDRKVALSEVMRIADPSIVPRLHDRLQLKVIRHDARIYLNDIAKGAVPAVAVDLLSELKPLIESIPRRIFVDLPLNDRLLMAAALAGDVELVKRMIHVSHGEYDLYGEWTADNGSALWEPKVFSDYAAGSLERELAVFDPSQLENIPWYTFKWLHRVRDVSINAANTITISGESPDSFGKFAKDGVDARLVIRERWGYKRVWTAPVEIKRREGNLIAWTSEFQFPADIDLAVRPKFSIKLQLTDGSACTSDSLRVTKGFSGSKAKTTPVGFLASGANVRYQPYCTVAGTLALRAARIGKNRRRVRRVLEPLLTRGNRVLRKRNIPLDSHIRAQEGVRIMESVAGKIDKTLVLVESHMGRSHFDSPRVIADELRRRRPDLRVVWSAEQGQNWAMGRDDIVVRHTEDYYRTLARAAYIIDNQGLPDGFVKQPGQVYVQTWHGIPIKKMGFDEASIAYASEESKRNFARKVGYWDFLTIPSNYFEEVFVPAFGFSGKRLPQGSPRNDALVGRSDTTAVAKTRLDLDLNRATVLYAPTFRTPGTASIELELDELVEALGEDVQILLRPHYLNRIRVPHYLRANVVDVSGLDDTSQVLLASDVLVSDYSSIIFDYLTLDRPVILYAYDLDDYMSAARGTYFDLREERPGPIVADQDELVRAIRKVLNSDEDAERRSRFREKFAGIEPGDSAQKTVDTVWGAE
ncbi:CDP-glycerol glycerophosphotransferase [Brevibacterium sanguinis]|uniref:CDP-glycerol glycerophosphotransferase n=2 Tax=Brevibacterium TaxID=1696 RepID=A0A366IIW1_9MICO|nr:CDP-glycerol glycerophosphotransferase [Brevibacterium sanguinis]RBP72054.1 CDP-glycerol glycerophosphotransferase [Brevibacterium celere]